MLGLVGKVVISNKQTKEKLKEWLDSIPEIARDKEPANILAFVFFVEVLKGKEERKGGADINA